MRDVARAAEVSVATVSRVLNSPEVVQPKTRHRVEQIIAQLDFHPSAAARAINTGRTKIVGALIPTLDSDFFSQTIEAIEMRLGEFGYSLVVATIGESQEKEVSRANELLNLGVEGLYLSGVTHSPDLLSLLERRRIPAVAISYYDAAFRYPTIGYDNRKAARMALDHLVEKGHRRIAVLHGPTASNDRTRDRVEGVRLDSDDLRQTFFETENSVDGGAAVVSRILAADEAFDAFLCVSDVTAFGVIFELQRQGIKVPDEAAVIGVHDLPLGRSMFPRLSTVRLPARQMGRQAAEALATWLDDGVTPTSFCFDAKLIERETT